MARTYLNWLVILLGITAPLFTFRVYASITIFDLVLLLTILIYFSLKISTKTFFLFLTFSLICILSELNGLNSFFGDGANIGNSFNVLGRYLILIFVIPYLSYKIFYDDKNGIYRINLFYEALLVSFFGVLLFNMYIIYYQIEEYFLFQRFSSIYGNPNTAALVMNIFSVLYLFRVGDSKIWMRVLSYLSIALIMLSIMVTGSFSGMLIQIIILSWFLIKYFNPKISILFSILLIGLLSIDFSEINQDSNIARGLMRFTELKNIFIEIEDSEILEAGSAGERIRSINASIYEIVNNPNYIFFGIGFGNIDELIHIQTGYKASVHLVYLQLILSIGIIATLMYLYIFLRVVTKIPRYFIGTNFTHQGVVIIGVFLILGIFIPHTYMSFYFAPVFPFLGLYAVKNELA